MAKVYVKRSQIHGKGIFASENIPKGKRVGIIKGPIRQVRGRFNGLLRKRSEDWIGAGRYTWIDTAESPFKYINHSCEPNAYIVGERTVRALRPIKKDEEIFMDYSLTEADPDWKLSNCSCGASSCRKTVAAIFSLPQVIYKKRKGIISKKFQKIYEVGRVF